MTAAVARNMIPADPTARRRHMRQRLVCTAYLEIDGLRPIVCIVRDLSDGGARLRVPLDFDIDGPVVLHVPELGWRRPVRIIWNQRHTIGVAFEAAAP
jgi:hypothetical protein